MTASLVRRIATERDRGYSQWAVVRMDTGELIGNCGLRLVEGSGPDVELAYHYKRSAWNMGYGIEAVVACLGQGFGPIGLERLIAICFPENIGSWRIMEKAGMQFVGLTDRHCGLTGLKQYVAERRAWTAPG